MIDFTNWVRFWDINSNQEEDGCQEIKTTLKKFDIVPGIKNGKVFWLPYIVIRKPGELYKEYSVQISTEDSEKLIEQLKIMWEDSKERIEKGEYNFILDESKTDEENFENIKKYLKDLNLKSIILDEKFDIFEPEEELCYLGQKPEKLCVLFCSRKNNEYIKFRKFKWTEFYNPEFKEKIKNNKKIKEFFVNLKIIEDEIQ